MGDKAPTVSIIMPVYNCEHYVGEAVKSILGQTFSDFEFIIIDDGSTDHSIDIIKSFKDHRIKLVENEKNLGISASLNRGLEFARSKYIARMDADDICCRQRLAVQIDYMSRNPEIGICGSWVKTFGRECHTWRTPVLPTEIKAELFWSCVLVHPSVMMKSEILKKYQLKYRLEYTYAEDYGLWVDASHHISLANIPKVLLYYRIHNENVSKTHKQQQAKNTFDIIKNNFTKLGYQVENDFFVWLTEKVISTRTVRNLTEARQFESCLISLKELNERKNIYDTFFFNHALAKQMFRVFVKSVNLGPGLLNLYCKSFVGGLSHLTREEVFRFYLKTYCYKAKLGIAGSGMS